MPNEMQDDLARVKGLKSGEGCRKMATTIVVKDIKEIEKSAVFGTLGDAVRSLKELPSKYMDEDLKLLEGDSFNNASAEFTAPDGGMWYRVEHKRVVSFPPVVLKVMTQPLS